MSLRHALLGLLAEAPMSGYDLTKRFEHSLGRVWPVRHSQIYTELKALQEESLIELCDYGPRGRKIYAITQAGLGEVRRWLAEPPDASARSMRFEPLLRLGFAWILEEDDLQSVLAAEEAHYREQVAWLDEMMATLPDVDSDGSIASRRAVALVGKALYGAMADAAAALRDTLPSDGD